MKFKDILSYLDIVSFKGMYEENSYKEYKIDNVKIKNSHYITSTKKTK